jgi:hypothetical protein
MSVIQHDLQPYVLQQIAIAVHLDFASIRGALQCRKVSQRPDCSTFIFPDLCQWLVGRLTRYKPISHRHPWDAIFFGYG